MHCLNTVQWRGMIHPVFFFLIKCANTWVSSTLQLHVAPESRTNNHDEVGLWAGKFVAVRRAVERATISFFPARVYAAGRFQRYILAPATGSNKTPSDWLDLVMGRLPFSRYTTVFRSHKYSPTRSCSVSCSPESAVLNILYIILSGKKKLKTHAF